MANGFNSLTLLLMAGLLIESIIETVKIILDCKNDFKCYVPKIAAIGIGIMVAFTYQLDIPVFLGFTAVEIPIVSKVLTGIIISRGANFIHDILDKFAALKVPTQIFGTIIPANKDTNVTVGTTGGQTTEMNITNKPQE